MKKPLLLLIFISSCLLQAQVTLTISIDKLENSEGEIALQLNDDEKNEVKIVKESIKDGKCTVSIIGLEKGKYVFKYFHDANSNDKLDTNMIGMPKEGFGFSNNAKGSFGPPPHKETIFSLQSDTIMHCVPLYF